MILPVDLTIDELKSFATDSLLAQCEEHFKRHTMSGDATLYEETFQVTSLVDDKYERVARIIGASQDSLTSLTLDINSELYPLAPGDNVSMCLATTLNLDGTKDERGWRDRKGEPSLADLWDYVCYGKVYRFEEGEEGKTIKCYISFGGLLMCLDGPHRKLSPLRIDHVYLCLKK